MKRLYVLLTILLLSTNGAQAAPGPSPDSLQMQANRMLSYKAFGRAIDLCNQVLAYPKLTAVQRSRAQASLAQAYRAMGDNGKAEQWFRQWQTTVPAGQEDIASVLAYAQTLAANGKFPEAQQQFERYEALTQAQQARQRDAANASRTNYLTSSQREPARYQLDDLSLNTGDEEFSPMFYKDGLVYVSGRKGGSTIETSGKGGGAGYLDLTYIVNRATLTAKRRIGPDGEVMQLKKSTTPARRQPSAAQQQRTAQTANDARLAVSFQQGINLSQGLGLGKKPASPEQQFAKSLNTKYHEGPATFSADGSQIIFTRNNYNNGKARTSDENVNTLKLYTARQVDGVWTDITELPFNSDEYSVGHPALCKGPDGTPDQLLYFASNMPGGLGGTDLYVSQWINNRWSEPVNLGPAINTKSNEVFPFADENGNLYFSTEGRRGKGGLDIFYAVMNGTTVQAIESIEAPINSNGDDFGLITSGARQTGYFSSNRNGSDDIFRFTRERSPSGCRDLTIRVFDAGTDNPIDSAVVTATEKQAGQTDQVLTVDKNGLAQLCVAAESDYLFTVTREGYVNSTIGLSTHAITDDQPLRLELSMRKPTVLLDTVYTGLTVRKVNRPSTTGSRIRGTVLGERDGTPIAGVAMRLKNDSNGLSTTAITGADGTYEFPISEKYDYTLTASKPLYGTTTSRISRPVKRAKPREVVATMRMWHVGDVVTIDNIYYDLGNSAIRPDAARELDRMLATMRRYPSLVIEIRSHTDSRGDAASNKELSTRRARAVVDYLVSKGISRTRMIATGYGESMLINNCTDGVICTEDEHQRNRRTEFKVLAIK